MAGGGPGRLPVGGADGTGRSPASPRRTRHRDRHRRRAGAQRVVREALGGLRGGRTRARLRVVLRRRRPQGAAHRSLRSRGGLRPDAIRRTRARRRFRFALPVRAGDTVPTEGGPQRPLSVRQRPQVQEVPSRRRRGRARREPRPGRDARAGRAAGPAPHPVRARRVRREVDGLRRRLRRSGRRRAAGLALVRLRLRGGRADGRRRLSRRPRAAPPARGAPLAGRPAGRVALGVGGRGGRARQDPDAARPAVRRAAHGVGDGRLADPGAAPRGAGPRRRPRRRLAALRHAPASAAAIPCGRGRPARPT